MHVPEVIVERPVHLLIFHEMARPIFFWRLAVLTDGVYLFQPVQGNIVILSKICQNHFLVAVLTDGVYLFQPVQGNIVILSKIGQNHFLVHHFQFTEKIIPNDTYLFMLYILHKRFSYGLEISNTYGCAIFLFVFVTSLMMAMI